MKYLVTGGAGYVGVHVVEALLRNGHEVVVASRSENINNKSKANYIKIDILENNKNIFDDTGKPDVVIHLAWEDGFFHNSKSHFENLPRHLNFIENMLSSGLKHIVGVGTMHEIGYHVGPVTDMTPTFPLHAYGVSKNFLRSAQSILCKEYGAVDQWIRCFYITGDDHLNNSIFAKLLAADNSGKKEFPLNSGELLYDFISVHDLASMIVDVSQQSEIQGIINCCSGDPITLKSMVLKFIHDNKLNIVPKWGEFPLRPYDSRAIWGDVEKINIIRKHSLKGVNN